MVRRASNPNTSTVWAGRGIALLFGLAAFTQVKLQVLERNSTINAAVQTNRYVQEHTEYGKRGTIFSSDGKPLASDESTYVLNYQAKKVPHTDSFYVDLGTATGIPASEFAALADGNLSRQWTIPLGPSQCDAVQDVKSYWRADGVSLKNTGRRTYPLGPDVSGIVGLFRENKPLSGMELSKDQILKATNGTKFGMADRKGRLLPTRIEDGGVQKVNGSPITLTIDSDLQSLASAAVRNAVKKFKADDGVALVVDPTNGDILAMASAPSFEPYEPDGSDGDMRGNSGYNPSYMGVLEPGSTFKILSLAIALEEGKVSMNDHFYCAGAMGIGRRTIHCDKTHGAHGDVTPIAAIAKSCNLSAARWAMMVGNERFMTYVEKMGLLRKPNLGLPRETRGLFNRKDPAKELQIALVGFGQAITTAPVSLAAAFSMIGNDGLMMAPRLIKRIGGRDMPVEPGTRIVKPDTAAKVMSAMEAVFSDEHGTGRSLRIPGYKLAGKTGTAQKIGSGSGYVANFVGFVPAEKPRALILVMVNHPQGGIYYGATVAGPVFQTIAKGVIRHFNIQPTEPITASVVKHSAIQ